jgi:RNA polymerase sigma-70 factor, ECF subfamily
MQNAVAIPSTAISVRGLRAGIQHTTDEALLEGIQEVSSAAMQVLFARHQVRVYRLIYRLVGNAAVAEDLTSEVFINVWRHAGQFKARSSVSTWLLAIARYKSLAELRRCRIKNRLSVKMAEEDLAETPESQLQTGDRKRIVQECLQRLSPEHRTIIDLVYYHEKSVSEVAEIVRIPPNTVKTRMYYARRKLAELLSDAGVVGVSP